MSRDLGMSNGRWQVLGAPAIAGRPLSVSQIARNMGLTRQSVQRTVNQVIMRRQADWSRQTTTAAAVSGWHIVETTLLLRRPRETLVSARVRTTGMSGWRRPLLLEHRGRTASLSTAQRRNAASPPQC
jgi:MarR family